MTDIPTLTYDPLDEDSTAQDSLDVCTILFIYIYKRMYLCLLYVPYYVGFLHLFHLINSNTSNTLVLAF